MVDIATLRLIFDVIRAIEDTADRVRCNRKDWQTIKGRSELVKKNLTLLQNNEELMNDSAVGDAVAALRNIFDEAKELLDECTVQRNTFSVWWYASRLSKKLSGVNNGISNANMDLITALNVRQACLLPTQHHGVHPQAVEPVGAPGGDEMAKQQASSMIHETVDTVNQINAMAKTSHRKKWECLEVAKRALKFSAFLSWLENTYMIKDPALSADLEKLVKTFHHAHELVAACQKRNFVPSTCQGGYGGRLSLNDRELSKELHQVLDQMVLDLDGMTEITMRYARSDFTVVGSREDATTTRTRTLSIQFTATLMVGRFVTKLWLARQRSQGITLHPIGHVSPPEPKL